VSKPTIRVLEGGKRRDDASGVFPFKGMNKALLLKLSALIVDKRPGFGQDASANRFHALVSFYMVICSS
jgi:hypothetical protein